MQLIDRPSPNFDPRPGGRAPDMLIMHATCMPDAQSALNRLCDPASGVSAHYLIDEAGRVFALVDEKQRAWHAGVAFWDGAEDINGLSVGIEICHPGPGEDDFGPGFPDIQMRALAELSRGILVRHGIPPHRVLAHSDVAPDRKTDPGPLFDWAGLAGGGIGLWSEAGPEAAGGPLPAARLQRGLRDFGYDVAVDGVCGPATQMIVKAFQLHYRPGRIDGRADAETCARLLDLLDRKQ